MRHVYVFWEMEWQSRYGESGRTGSTGSFRVRARQPTIKMDAGYTVRRTPPLIWPASKTGDVSRTTRPPSVDNVAPLTVTPQKRHPSQNSGYFRLGSMDHVTDEYGIT